MNKPSVNPLYRLMLSLLLLQPMALLASQQYSEIVHEDQVISIHYHASFTEAERKMAQQWLKQVTDALLTVYGELPKDDYRISIERSASRHSPVPWGHVERGLPTNVVLVINPDLGYESLIDDWTAFHELSHLLLPYRGHGNIWLSEGLATYYQNIIQARSGQFDETEMWSRLVAGFKRGSEEQRWRHVTLAQVSDNLRETRQYMRVHWSGVLYWLTADIELRKYGKTLDGVLKELRNCCESRSMSAEQIVSKLDELSDSELFVPLFEKYCESYATPEFEPLLVKLGVGQNGTLRAISFDKDAELSAIRRQIYFR